MTLIVSLSGQLVALDATILSDVATKYEISGYPTQKHFLDGKPGKKHPTGRDIKTIVNFMSQFEPEVSQ